MTDASIKFQGSKYEATKDLRPQEVAKLIRADVKAAVAGGALPTFNPAGGVIRYSVRFRWATHEAAIDVEVTNWGETRQANAYVLNDNGYWGPAWQTDPVTGDDFVSWMNPRTWRANQVLEGIHGAYQQDRSDSMTDYFHVRYYGSVSFSEGGPAGRVSKAAAAAKASSPTAAERGAALRAGREVDVDEAMLGEARVARHEESKYRHLSVVH